MMSGGLFTGAEDLTLRIEKAGFTHHATVERNNCCCFVSDAWLR